MKYQKIKKGIHLVMILGTLFGLMYNTSITFAQEECADSRIQQNDENTYKISVIDNKIEEYDNKIPDCNNKIKEKENEIVKIENGIDFQ